MQEKKIKSKGMRRNEIFELIFDINPDFVIAECDEQFFSETLEDEDLESIKERMRTFIHTRD